MDSDIPGPRADREIQLAHERPFRLGALEVRPPTREVIGPRGREVLEPRVMQVLVALARARGEVVGRDDLIASCWEGRVVGEDAISRVISRLRRLTEGIGRDGWTLETVTKVGYRLLPAGHDPAATSRTNAAAATRSGRRMVLAVASGGAVAALTGAAFWWRSRARPASSEASALYEKGREALLQGLPEPVAQAVGFLREAVAEAPNDAKAWGALALAYQASLTYTGPTRQDGVMAQAQAAAKRALELDPNEPDGAAALALLAPQYRNWEAAEPLYRRALSLHPRQSALQAAYAKFLLGVGRIRASVAAAEAAMAADRFSPVNHHGLARSLWSAGRTEEAELVLRKALGLWPEHYALWFLRFYLLAHTGRADQALAIGEDVASRPISVPAADIELSLMGARAVLSRAPSDVDAAVDILMTAAKRGAGYAETGMGWMAALGRLDEGFGIARGMYFGEGFSIGATRYSTAQGRFMVEGTRNTHPLFMPPTAALRLDPRFGTLMRDLGVGHYWAASGHGPDDPVWTRGA
jgi:DNA-binding winged helix-turn-helix (wHTH) protein/Tfp pilus assembly protein PilF